MKIRFIEPIANRRRGEIIELDDAGATILIFHGYAEPVDQPAATTDRAPSPHRPRTRRAVAHREPGVGDDPLSEGTGSS